MSVVFWALVAFATVSCLFMAWSLGANSNSPPFAPAIGANAVSTMRAAFLIGILAAAGALTQGGPSPRRSARTSSAVSPSRRWRRRRGCWWPRRSWRSASTAATLSPRRSRRPARWSAWASASAAPRRSRRTGRSGRSGCSFRRCPAGWPTSPRPCSGARTSPRPCPSLCSRPWSPLSSRTSSWG